MKRLSYFLLFISLITIFALASCDTDPYKSPTGKAAISIDNKIVDSSNTSGGTSQSTTTIFIKEYKITASGPNGAKIDETVEAEKAAISYDSLTVGNWKIEVEALNYNGAIVGYGYASTKIEEKENQITIDVSEQEGKGKLLVQIQYPGQYIAGTPSKELSLKLSSKEVDFSTQEVLARVGNNGNDYYYTLMDLDNGFYNIQITDKSSGEIYSNDIRVVNDAITSTAVSVDKNDGIIKRPVRIIALPELSFSADNYVAQNCSSYFIQFRYNTHDNGDSIYRDIICFGLDYDDKPSADYTPSMYYAFNIEAMGTTVGKHKLTLYLKIGDSKENKVICSKDFYFEVTEPVEENTLNNLIINALPENFLCGNQTESDGGSYVGFTLSAQNTRATLNDDTLVIFNTEEGESITVSCDYQLTGTTTHYDIYGNIDITHDNTTSEYSINSLSFDTTLSSNGLCASNISGRGITKDGEDISDNQTELEKLVSYFIALFECNQEENGITFQSIIRYVRGKYVFESYKSGNYSIDGFVNYRRTYNGFEEIPYSANIENSELTFKNGNDTYHLKFRIFYKVEGTQQDPNTIILAYSDFSINDINLNEMGPLNLSEEALGKIKQFVLYFEK